MQTIQEMLRKIGVKPKKVLESFDKNQQGMCETW